MKNRMMFFALVFLFLIVSIPMPLFAAVTPLPTSVVMEEKSEYLLPYPGILPDHPLYFLKQVRDGIMDRLIVDPLRKAEFHILQADKRLNMGKLLVEQGKGTLAESTISKGENYIERAAHGLAAFKSTGRSVPASLIDRLTRSMEKHVEVLGDLGFTGPLEFVKNLQSEVEKLK